MATVTKPIALDESFNTTEVTPRNIADVLAEGLSHITGRTASEVEYDNTDSGLTSDDVQGAIDELSERPTLPTTDIQTAVDEFETYNGGLLSECKVALSPNQDLHGYPEPWVGGAGKNKLPLNADNIKSLNGGSGTWTNNKKTINDVEWEIVTDSADNVIGVRANSGTATLDSNIVLVPIADLNSILGDVDYIMTGCPSGGNISKYYIGIGGSGADYGNGVTIRKPLSGTNCVCRIAQGYTANNVLFTPMLRLSTESDPTFAPYSNICPISGHTQVEVDVSDGQTTQEQVTVNLGGTYYSGTLDVVSGELTVDSAFIASYNGETLPSTWISDRDVYAVGTTPTTGAEVCYKLATPTPIQLTPQQVKALVGENHLSTPLDGQEITESKYKQMFTFDDVIAYIQSLS